MKKALFPGTFDPFTKGHYSLINRGLDLFDEIIIAIGFNESKNTHFSLQHRIQMIRDLYQNESRIAIEAYSCLTIDFAREKEAKFILRGIRTINDFEYEKTIADINRKLGGVETYVLFTEPELTHISSTIVRELLHFGHDITDFIPDGMKI